MTNTSTTTITTNTEGTNLYCNANIRYGYGGNAINNSESGLIISRSFPIHCTLNFPEIKDVIFNDPATIVLWTDGTKTVVKTDDRYGDVFDKEKGLAMAICKRAFDNKGNFNNVFKKWIWNKE